MYKIKILLNRHLTTPLFCKHALKSSLECKIVSAVEQFCEKNNNVKPTCHKNLSGKVLLTDCLFFLFIFLLSRLNQTLAVSINWPIGTTDRSVMQGAVSFF